MINGKWEDECYHTIAGKTLRWICEEYAGRECVARVLLAGKDCYLCGTEALKRTMLQKGKSMTFAEAVDLLGKAAAGVLEKEVV